MPTATKTSLLKELQALEDKRDDVRSRLKAQRRDHHATLTAVQELGRQRRLLTDRDPELVDHQDQPLDEQNAVAQIDAEIAELGSVEEKYAKVMHTQKLVAVAQARVDEFIQVNSAELLAEFDAQEGDGAREAWASGAKALRAAGDRINARDHRRHQLGADQDEHLINEVSHILSRLEVMQVTDD